MTVTLIKKVRAGYHIDGLYLLGSSCSCGGLGDCCLTYSTVKQDNHIVAFFAKATTPTSSNTYEWGYRVRKGPVEVDVLVYDTRDPKNFPFGGKYPPLLAEWQQRGWQVISQFERPLTGTGTPLPA